MIYDGVIYAVTGEDDGFYYGCELIESFEVDTDTLEDMISNSVENAEEDDSAREEDSSVKKKYNLTVHYQFDPDDLEGYDEEIEASNIEEAKDYVQKLDDFNRINYYILESEDGDEYYNSSEEEGWVDRC